LLSDVSLFTVPYRSVPHTFFPFGEEEGDSSLFADDAVSPAVNISIGFPYIFDIHRSLFVSIDVILTPIVHLE